MEVLKEVVVPIAVAAITAVGMYIGSKHATKQAVQATQDIVVYRIDKLEAKVDKHNNVIERTYVLETEQKEINRRLAKLEKED